ncbi:hypothetical protein MP228_004350 [Amoeboaphelidium protococcarum]|nr:hypothetical protein MP228_004350 [Amoeboaphelidium protococcarum]
MFTSVLMQVAFLLGLEFMIIAVVLLWINRKYILPNERPVPQGIKFCRYDVAKMEAKTGHQIQQILVNDQQLYDTFRIRSKLNLKLSSSLPELRQFTQPISLTDFDADLATGDDDDDTVQTRDRIVNVIMAQVYDTMSKSEYFDNLTREKLLKILINISRSIPGRIIDMQEVQLLKLKFPPSTPQFQDVWALNEQDPDYFGIFACGSYAQLKQSNIVEGVCDVQKAQSIDIGLQFMILGKFQVKVDVRIWNIKFDMYVRYVKPPFKFFSVSLMEMPSYDMDLQISLTDATDGLKYKLHQIVENLVKNYIVPMIIKRNFVRPNARIFRLGADESAVIDFTQVFDELTQAARQRRNEALKAYYQKMSQGDGSKRNSLTSSGLSSPVSNGSQTPEVGRGLMDSGKSISGQGMKSKLFEKLSTVSTQLKDQYQKSQSVHTAQARATTLLQSFNNQLRRRKGTESSQEASDSGTVMLQPVVSQIHLENTTTSSPQLQLKQSGNADIQAKQAEGEVQTLVPKSNIQSQSEQSSMVSKADSETKSADAKELGDNSTKQEAHHSAKEQPLLVDLSASSNPNHALINTDNSSVSQHQEGEERDVFHPDGNLSLEDLMNSIEEEISMENARLSPPLLPPRENTVLTHSVTLPVVNNDDNHDIAMDEDDTLDDMIMKEMMALNQETVAATDLQVQDSAVPSSSQPQESE